MPITLVLEEMKRQAFYTSWVVGSKTTDEGYVKHN